MNMDPCKLIEENRVLRDEVIYLNRFVLEIMRTLVEIEMGLEKLVRNGSNTDNIDRRSNLVVLRGKERPVDAG